MGDSDQDKQLGNIDKIKRENMKTRYFYKNSNILRKIQEYIASIEQKRDTIKKTEEIKKET